MNQIFASASQAYNKYSNSDESIGSIGTEISRSASNMMNSNTNTRIVQDNQISLITIELMNIIKQNQLAAANMIMNAQFVPDTTVVNENGDNILHFLMQMIDNADKKPNNALLLLQSILKKNADSVVLALNQKNKQGVSPLNIAEKLPRETLNSILKQQYVIETEDSAASSDGIYDPKNSEPNKNKRDAAKNFLKPNTSITSIFSKPPTATNEAANALAQLAISTSDTTAMFADTVADPVADTNPRSINSAQFIDYLINKLSKPPGEYMHNGKYIHDGGEYMRGGAAHKNKASAVNRKRIAHRISNKTTKVTGTRKMIGFSEVANDYDLFGGMSENEMKNISRAATNQKNQFHEETIEKILSHLSNKDKMTAKAIKAIIYDEIKHSKTELSGLDKASEMLKMITKKKVDEILTQKALINKIVSYLSQKNTEKEKIAMASSNSSKHTTKTKTKTKTKTGKNKDKNFESSVEVTSSDKKSSDVMTGGERLHNSAKKSKKKSELFYF
jgi:hypothetical protein